MAFTATYQDHRMIAQRSCFTIHGTMLEPIEDILRKKNMTVSDCLYKYEIADTARTDLLKDLSLLGISVATRFSDLDHFAQDLVSNVNTINQKEISEGMLDSSSETLSEDETLRWIG
jgi:hypothetical protein